MSSVLILSSFVAASPVGGSLQARVLARMGHEPVLVPTVVFGRHPGLGAPGGAPMDPAVFESLLAGVAKTGAFERASAVIAGYFADAPQVDLAAKTIEAVRAAKPTARIIVDPILGDRETGLYVAEATADAIADTLVPLADLVTPNAWELARLAGVEVTNPGTALAAARSLGRAVLASSIPSGDDIGVLLVEGDAAWLASHQPSANSEKGLGDLLTALYVGHILGGANSARALRASVEETAAVAAGRRLCIDLRKL